MGANMNQPEEERKKLAQLREQFALKAQLQKEYQDYANKVHPTRQMTFNDWMAQRNTPKMADGGQHPFANITKEQFLGSPRITKDSNAKDLIPSGGKSLDDSPEEPFAAGNNLKAKYGKNGVAVYDEKGNVIGSYSFGDTLVVDKKHRRQGIGSEMVYQWRIRNPEAKPAESRTKKSQALQEKVWDRIQREINQGKSHGGITHAHHLEIEERPL